MSLQGILAQQREACRRWEMGQEQLKHLQLSAGCICVAPSCETAQLSSASHCLGSLRPAGISAAAFSQTSIILCLP